MIVYEDARITVERQFKNRNRVTRGKYVYFLDDKNAERVVEEARNRD